MRELGNDLVWLKVITCSSLSCNGSQGRNAYMLVNNRSEGNAPLTVQGLVGMLRG